MKTITLVNEKGGVGKTTLSSHLAAGLALKGRRVLLLDMDAQGHSTIQLQLREFGGAYRLIVQEAEWQEVLREPSRAAWSPAEESQGRLMVLPSNVETRLIPLAVDDVLLLRERLMELEEFVDVVVIDTSPTPSLLHSMIYVASDYVLFPTECEALALKGLVNSSERLNKAMTLRASAGLADMEFLGVQPTMFTKTLAHQHGFALIRKHFGERQTGQPIVERTIWREASYAKRTMFGYAPGHVATNEAWAFVNRVERRIS